MAQRHMYWGITDDLDLGRVHADKLTELAEYHDKLGTLQGWTFDRDNNVELIFEHGIVTYESGWEYVRERTIFRFEDM